MDILETLKELFKDNQAAYSWLEIFIRYIHAIDDSIDEPRNPEKIVETHFLASIVFGSEYFIQYKHILGSCWHTILNAYATSVKWETEEGRKEWADQLRHCGIEMLSKVVLIEFGWDKQREIDPSIREKALKS